MSSLVPVYAVCSKVHAIVLGRNRGNLFVIQDKRLSAGGNRRGEIEARAAGWKRQLLPGAAKRGATTPWPKKAVIPVMKDYGLND